MPISFILIAAFLAVLLGVGEYIEKKEAERVFEGSKTPLIRRILFVIIIGLILFVLIGSWLNS